MANQSISQFSTELPTDSAFVAGYVSATAGGNAKFSFAGIYTYIMATLAGDGDQVTINDLNVTTSLTAGSLDLLSDLTLSQGLTVTGNLVSQSGRTLSVAVFTTNGPFTIEDFNDVVIIKKASPSISSVILPAAGSGTIGRRFTIKDGNGDAGTFAINITTAGGTINGASAYSLTVDYATITVVDGGGDYFTI